MGYFFYQFIDKFFCRIHLKYKSKEPDFFKTLLSGSVPSFLFPLLIPIFQWVVGRKVGNYNSFSDSELKQLYRRNLQAASDFLGDKEFFGGSEPNLVCLLIFFSFSSYNFQGDFSVFSQLASIYYLNCTNELKSIIEDYPNLRKNMNTIFRKYFADFEIVDHLKE